MADGDNILLDSMVLSNDGASDGVRTTGTGCMTIAGVIVTGHSDEGIEISHSGTANIFDAHVTGTNDEGFDLNGGTDGMTCIYMDGVSSSGTEEEGIDADFDGMLDIRNSEFLGNDQDGILIDTSVFHLLLADNFVAGNDGNGLEINDDATGVSTNTILVQFYGTNTFIGNDINGIDNNVDETSTRTEVWGNIVSFGNSGDGVSITEDSGNAHTFVLAEGANMESCLSDPESPPTTDNTDFAFGPGVTFVDLGGTVICDTIDTDGNIIPAGFSCSPGCLPVNTAFTCTA